jgi:hypothetical protein
MTPAIVNVLPVPVAPSRVSKRSPAARPSESDSMAAGWSAVAVYAGFSLNLAMRPR